MLLGALVVAATTFWMMKDLSLHRGRNARAVPGMVGFTSRSGDRLRATIGNDDRSNVAPGNNYSLLDLPTDHPSSMEVQPGEAVVDGEPGRLDVEDSMEEMTDEEHRFRMALVFVLLSWRRHPRDMQEN